jgi:TetR/AcrR family transcriptional regulator, fatty acid metabolism regulator protein
VPQEREGGGLPASSAHQDTLLALTERASASEDKRRQILDAAVRVFARKGFHASRVGDIAEEAGVAHGLLYHYFASKDAVLQAVFQENWNVLIERIGSVEETDEPAVDQLRHVAAIILRTWLHLPDVVRVVIQEFGRSPELAERIGDLEQPIDLIERVIARGVERGEFRQDIDSRVAATVVYGGIDELLTAWVLDRLPAAEADVAAAEKTFFEINLRGLLAN